MSRLRLLTAPAGPDAVSTTAAAATAPQAGAGSTWFVVSYSIAIIGLAAGASLTYFEVFKPVAFVAADGFGALSLFYIVAQALERFFEPIASRVNASPPDGEKGSSDKPDKNEAKRMVNSYIAKAYSTNERQANMDLAAKWQAVVEAIRKNTAVLLFGLTAAAGALLASYFGLYLMRAVGAGAVPTWVDVIITGLVISGGSKGLHDLIKNIEKAKEQKDDPPEATG